MPLARWPGISMDTFSQLTHALVVLFRLTTHDDGDDGWDAAEVRRRADVLAVLDRACDTLERIPAALGIVDADGPRSGLFFKSTYLFRAIKALFVREMGARGLVGGGAGGGGMGMTTTTAAFSMADATGSDVSMDGVGQPALVDDFIMNLSNEPWLADLLAMGPSWNSGPEAFLYPPYTEY